VHLTAERGWLNDPNGPLRLGGRHHLFFQSHPHAPAWGPPQWDHVSSTDLVHWRRHPPALLPSAHGPDRDGCWSGCVRVVDGRVTAFYTGVTGSTDADRVESVCRAHALDDQLDRWQVDPAPLVQGGTGFARDPFVWQDEHGWHLLLGTGDGVASGAVDHYRSPDGSSWERTGVFFADPTVGGRHWECPQLLRFPDGDVLVLSVQDGTPERPVLRVVQVVGRLVEDRFHGVEAGPLEHGDVLYAPAVAPESDGRQLLWGWLRETVPEDRLADLEPVGALSLPLDASLEEGRLVLRLVPELSGLRRSGGPAQPGDLGPLVRPAEVELVLGDGAVLLELGPEESVEVRRSGRRLVVDRSRVSRAPWAPAAPVDVPVPDGPVRLRLLLDGSVLVVAVDDVLAAVTRVHPLSGACGRVRARGAVTDAHLWRLGPAGPEQAAAG
jgi:beta-fructofuranosidase